MHFLRPSKRNYANGESITMNETCSTWSLFRGLKWTYKNRLEEKLVKYPKRSKPWRIYEARHCCDTFWNIN